MSEFDSDEIVRIGDDAGDTEDDGFSAAQERASQRAWSETLPIDPIDPRDAAGRPAREGENVPPRELTEAEYKKLADEIAKSGQIPERLKEALKNGIGPGGIDLVKLNKMLEGTGLHLEIHPMDTGLKLDLVKKGKVIDSEVAKTPAARRSAERIRQGEKGGEGDGVRPREMSEKEYKRLADEIAKTGKIPEELKKALERGLDPNGRLDLNKLNEHLKAKGLKLVIRPLDSGLQMDLIKPETGRVLDSEVAKTPAAKAAAERMRRDAGSQGPGGDGSAPGRPPGSGQHPPEQGTPLPGRPREPLPPPQPGTGPVPELTPDPRYPRR